MPVDLKPSREDEERRLFDEYNGKVREYSRLVGELAQRGIISQGDYMRRYRECDRARVLCEIARLALESFRNSS